MTGFGNAVRGEALKVTTTRMWWVLGIILFVYLAFIGFSLAATFGSLDPEASPAEGGLVLSVPLSQLVYSSAGTIGYAFPLIAGALAVTGEFRHQTVTPTFLATPRRGVSLAAKSLVQLGIGLLYGVIAFAAVMLAGGVMLTVTGAGAGLGDPDTWTLAARGVLAMGLWAVVGAGFGALVRNQVAAIVVVLALTQFVEPILRSIAMVNEVSATISQVLPGAASDALIGTSIYSTFGAGVSDPMPWWGGGLLLLAYAIGTAALGYYVTWRKDVT